MSPEQTATAAQKLYRCDYFITVRHCACVGREEGCLFKDRQVVAESFSLSLWVCVFVCVRVWVCVCQARRSHHSASQCTRSPRFSLPASNNPTPQVQTRRKTTSSPNRHDAIDSSATLDIFGPQMRVLAIQKIDASGIGYSRRRPTSLRVICDM